MLQQLMLPASSFMSTGMSLVMYYICLWGVAGDLKVLGSNFTNVKCSLSIHILVHCGPGRSSHAVPTLQLVAWYLSQKVPCITHDSLELALLSLDQHQEFQPQRLLRHDDIYHHSLFLSCVFMFVFRVLFGDKISTSSTQQDLEERFVSYMYFLNNSVYIHYCILSQQCWLALHIWFESIQQFLNIAVDVLPHAFVQA